MCVSVYVCVCVFLIAGQMAGCLKLKFGIHGQYDMGTDIGYKNFSYLLLYLSYLPMSYFPYIITGNFGNSHTLHRIVIVE